MKPLILISNDDGVDSPGLKAMAEAVSGLGEILIAAPVFQQTSMGRAFPRSEGLGQIEERKLYLSGQQVTGYGVYGSPAYAVAHGVLELADRLPDICISGVNYGENLGTNLTCSGTVGAILEANTYGIPGIAFSVPAAVEVQRSNDYPVRDWCGVKEIVQYWTKKCLTEGMKYNATMLNINIPDPVPDKEKYCYTRQSSQGYFYFHKPGVRERTKAFELSSVIGYRREQLQEDDDIYAVCIRKVTSVTPLGHDLTAPGF